MNTANTASEATTAPAPLWPPVTDGVARAAAAAGSRRAGHDEGEDLLARMAVWPLTRTARAARLGMTGLGTLVAVIRLPSVVDGEWSNFRTIGGYVVVTLGCVLVATIVVRTITVRTVVSFLLLGLFVSGPIVDGLGTLLNDHLSGNAYQAVAVPLVEEVMKLLPVVGFAVLALRVGRGVGAIDLAVLGTAVGGAFGLYEDMLWGRAFTSGFEGWGVIFPTMLQTPIVAAGHLVWTGCAGLGVGVMLLHRRHLWAWIAGPVLVLVPLVDHAAINYRGEEQDALRALLLDGRAVAGLFLAGLVVGIAMEARIVARSGASDHLFRSTSAGRLLTAPLPPLFGGTASVRQVQRLRNEAVYQWHRGGRPPTRLAAALARESGAARR